MSRSLYLGLNVDADFAEVLAALQISKCVRQSIQPKGAIDHRTDVMRFDCTDHVNLIAPAADGDALQSQPLGLHDRERHLVSLESGDRTDDRDMRAGACGDQRLWQGIRAADLDDVVHAETTRQIEHRLTPLLDLAMIDDVIRAEAL